MIEGITPYAVPVRRHRVEELLSSGCQAVGTLEEAHRRGGGLCVIATDTGRHMEDSVAALKMGFHLLVEKPLASDAQGARTIVEESCRVGRSVFVGCVLRFSESLNRFRQWLPKVGKIHSVEIECRSYLPGWRSSRPYRDSYSARAGEGGVLRDLIHEVDYAGWIFGWPSRVFGNFINTGQLGISEEEVAQIDWVSAEGFSVSIHLDYLTRPARRGIRACGKDGTMEWDGRQGQVTLSLEGSSVQEFRSAQTRDEMFLKQARAWLVSIEGPVDPQLATAEDGVRALAVCDAARLSSETRREETVFY